MTVAAARRFQVDLPSYFACSTTLLPSGGLGVTVPVSLILSSPTTASFAEICSVTWYFVRLARTRGRPRGGRGDEPG